MEEDLNKKKSTLNGGIIIFPTSSATITQLVNLKEIVFPLVNELYIIAGNKGFEIFKDEKRLKIFGITHKTENNNIKRVLHYIKTQLKMANLLIKISPNVDFWIFMGGDTYIIPMLASKVMKKYTYVIIAGHLESESELKSDINPLYSIILSYTKKIVLNLTNKIIVYSPRLLNIWGLTKYENKIIIAHRHFLNFNLFKVTQNYDQRKNVIGFVGRLSEEKGIINFIDAIIELNKTGYTKRHDLNFLIIGSGPLKKEIEKKIENLESMVKLEQWVPHNKLPKYLNKLKLLIIPSYTEGLPNIMLESMACGVPVLSNSVGAIPDIITNGKNGFLMDNNEPDNIAKNVIIALNHPDMKMIIQMANNTVKNHFNLNVCIEKYKNIIDEFY